MKKFSTLLLAFISIASISNAQSFTDDFESYTAGSLLAGSSATWATWSGAGGGTDDVAVSNALAHSGNNSVFLTSTTTGGPSDLVLPFSAQYSSGSFDFESWMYVNANKGAYFNYQGTATLGSIYSMDVTFETNGNLKFENSGTLLFQTPYPHGQWFDFKMMANLNNSSWAILIDGNQVGSFQNPAFNIAAMDFYPIQNSAFYMDDVSYNYTPYTLPNLNAAAMSLSVPNGLATQTRVPTVTVRNLGTTAITSFDLQFNYNGNQNSQSFTGVNYASGSVHTVTLTQSVTLGSGALQASMLISNVNGNANDDDAIDDTAYATVTAVTPAPGKVVVGEEATGTWCPWCVRGTVFMDFMGNKYDNFFAGIAVHNNDPMEDSAYDANMLPWISGYPGLLVDRDTVIDPSAVEQSFLQKIVMLPKAILTNGAIWNSATRELKVSIKTTLTQNTAGKYTIACVLTEDSVHKTVAGWAQNNAYAGGSNGVMGGFELLPNPVPATQMYYNHVARFIYPDFLGAANSYPMSMSTGDSFVHNFTFYLPSDWNENKIHIIGLFNNENNLAADGNGVMDNASTSSISEAVANGYLTGTDLGGLGTPNGI
ncbi:MAG: Omp28-related outer membrane protein, partial [Bacteroidota bacterium]